MCTNLAEEPGQINEARIDSQILHLDDDICYDLTIEFFVSI